MTTAEPEHSGTNSCRLLRVSAVLSLVGAIAGLFPPRRRARTIVPTKAVAPETRKRESSNAPFALYEPVTPRRLHRMFRFRLCARCSAFDFRRTIWRRETGEKIENGERKRTRQECSRRCSAERMHSLLTVPSAENAYARQAPGSLTLLTLRTASASH